MTDSMAGNSVASGNDTEIGKMIRQIQAEQNRFDRELRAAPRHKIVLPVALRLQNCSTFVHAFTRNLSATGMCVISDRPFKPRTQCTVMVHRLGVRNQDEILAQCCWCKTFGVGYWATGWKFQHVGKKVR